MANNKDKDKELRDIKSKRELLKKNEESTDKIVDAIGETSKSTSSKSTKELVKAIDTTAIKEIKRDEKSTDEIIKAINDSSQKASAETKAITKEAVVATKAVEKSIDPQAAALDKANALFVKKEEKPTIAQTMERQAAVRKQRMAKQAADAAKRDEGIKGLVASLRDEAKQRGADSEAATARMESEDSKMAAMLKDRLEEAIKDKDGKGLPKINLGIQAKLVNLVGINTLNNKIAEKREKRESREAASIFGRTNELVKQGMDQEAAQVYATEEARENRSMMEKLKDGIAGVGDKIKDVAEEKGASMFTTLMTGLGLIMAVMDPKMLMNFITSIMNSVLDLWSDLKEWWNGDEGIFGIFEVLYDNFATVLGIVGIAMVKFLGIGKVASLLINGLTLLMKGLALLSWPVLAIVALVALIVAGVLYAYHKLTSLEEEMGLDDIMDGLPVLGAVVKDLFAKLINGIIGFINFLIPDWMDKDIDFKMDTDNEAKAKQELIDSGKAKKLADGSRNPKYDELQKAKLASATKAGLMGPDPKENRNGAPVTSVLSSNNTRHSSSAIHVHNDQMSATAAAGGPLESRMQ